MQWPGGARQYTINNDAVAKSAEKLSSGYRINRAGDDAAGLAISEKMRSQIRGLTMAAKNSQDAISLVQTAEGALQETHSMLQRMNELAVQAATGTNEDLDRNALAKEFDQLKKEINDVAEQTTFNNMKILDGSMSYTGYDRSAATVGVTVTRPTSSAGTAAATTPGATIKDVASGLDMTETPNNGNITVKVAYKNEAGEDKEVTLTAAVTNAGGTLASQAGTDGIELTGPEGWSGTIAADGKISITNTNETFTEGNATITIDVDNATTGLTASTTSPATAAISTVAKAEADAAEAAKNGAASQASFDLTGAEFNGSQANGATVTMTINDSNGQAIGTITGGALGTTANDADAIGAALNGKTATVDGVDYDVAYDTTSKKITLTAQNPEDADLTGATFALAAGGTATPPNSTAVSDVTVGKAPAETTATTTSAKPSSTVIECDFVKMEVGDVVKVDIGGTEVEITKTSDSRDDFIKGLQTAIADLDLGEGASVKVSGTAIVVTGDVTVGEPTLDTDALAGTNTDAMRIQVGALENEQLNISIDSMNTKGLNLDSSNLYTQDAAGSAITAVRDAINKVSDQRATLGAMQNRLEHKIANLNVSTENLSAAESRIRDVDMASEMTNFTKNNILSQAATAMLAQANALPQNVLSLLG